MNRPPEQPEEGHSCGTDVAAYALGALEPAEAEAFVKHLQTCVVCRDELAEFQSAVAMLPLSVPSHAAPPSLRDRILGAVQNEAGQAPVRSPRRRWSALMLPRPVLAAGLAVAVLAVAVLGGLELGRGQGPSTRVYAAQVAGSPGSAKVTVTGGRAELIVHHLNAPPAGKVYEVWLGRPHQQPAPTNALFSVTRSGDGDVAVPGNLHGVDVVMVTPEPAGGSRVPTHAPVILARLT